MIDVFVPAEVQQTEVDKKTKTTTLHTGLKLPDGCEGFLIIGRIVRDKHTQWEPLKEVISKILIEYNPKYEITEDTTPAHEDSVRASEDTGGLADNGQ